MTITKEEKIKHYYTQIENFKKSITNPDTFDNAILSSSSPKKDRIRLWGETLEKIFYLEGRHDEIDSISTIITLELRKLNLNKSIPYVRMVLPSKYKDGTQAKDKQLLKDTYDNCDNNYRETFKYSKENELEIKNCEEDIKILQHYIAKLEQMPLLSKLDLIQYDEYQTNREASRQLLKEAMDNRDKVLPSKLHLLMMAFTETSKSDAFNKYLNFMREITKMTPKQAVKLLSGRVNKVESLYDPTNQQEARHVGFYGKPCPECGSYRVDRKYNSDTAENMLFCYACRKWSPKTVEELMEKLV